MFRHVDSDEAMPERGYILVNHTTYFSSLEQNLVPKSYRGILRESVYALKFWRICCTWGVGSLFSMVQHLHHVGLSHSTLRFPCQRLFLMNLPALLISPKSFAMDLIISSSQSLSTLHDVPIEKEVCIGLDIDAVTEATDSEMTEADGSSQTSSWNGAEDEHEHGSTSSFQQQLADEDVAPLSPEETLLVRKSSILLRSSSAGRKVHQDHQALLAQPSPARSRRDGSKHLFSGSSNGNRDISIQITIRTLFRCLDSKLFTNSRRQP